MPISVNEWRERDPLARSSQAVFAFVMRKKASGVPKGVVTKEDVKKFKEEIMKLPAPRAGLPGNVIPLYIVPPVTPRKARGLRDTFRPTNFVLFLKD